MTDLEQEPTGYGHELLTMWAEWTRGGTPGGHHEWSVREKLDNPHEDDVPDDVLMIDRIVARIGVEFPVYRKMLKRYYLGREAYWMISGVLGYTAGFVKLSIQATCDLVLRRYEDLQSPGESGK